MAGEQKPCGLPVLCEIKVSVTKDRRYIDDLPSLSISKLRAAHIITAETTQFVVRLGDVEQRVGVTLRKFP